MKFKFKSNELSRFETLFKTKHSRSIQPQDWNDWHWQMRMSLKTQEDFEHYLKLTENESTAFSTQFSFRCTPYYLSLILNAPTGHLAEDPIRKIVVPQRQELSEGLQQMLDPLGERKNNPVKRIIHRYTDRALFLVTDLCSVYCRYCTRKHFTASDQSRISNDEYQEALKYLEEHSEIKEVILSGGDPLTLSDEVLEAIISDLHQIKHIELIRIGSRMPVVCPMRITENLVQTLKKYHPIYIMTHFNHPREITQESAEALTRFVDNGFPVFNQLVLLNGVNNHPNHIQKLSRDLLKLRVKPYYMFQCDPSQGTDHLRTSIQNSLWIQKSLWGHISGLAMPILSVDIPDGGGKTSYVPNFEKAIERLENGVEKRVYVGWDGVHAQYLSPAETEMLVPIDVE